jgi:hypothetical protein
MNRPKKAVKKRDLELSEIFKLYNVSNETSFVKAFFEQTEVNEILQDCGFSPLNTFEPEFEFPIKVGHSTKRADLVIKNVNTSTTVYYFEVMSQMRNGKWDDEHHEQFILKRSSLQAEYGADNVYTFPVAFKEFDTCYLDMFQKFDDCFAIHLRFFPDYKIDVYGVEEKKERVSEKKSRKIQIGQKLSELLSTRIKAIHVEKYNIIKVGEFITNSQGIEVYVRGETKLAIKLHRDLYKKRFSKFNELIPEIIENLNNEIPGIYEDSETQDYRIDFNFDCTDYSNENIDKLAGIIKVFAETANLDKFIK